MAFNLYPNWKQAAWQEAQTLKSLDQTTAQDGVYCALLTSGYTYNQANSFYSDLGANVIGTPLQVTNNTFNLGTPPNFAVFTGDQITFLVVNQPVAAFVLYRHNAGANTTWRLVYFCNDATAGLPVSPAGGNVLMQWNATGIFSY